MNASQVQVHRRILVIDDNPSIQADFKKILAPTEPDHDEFDRASRQLFGGEPPSLTAQTDFQLDLASQGREGLGLLQRALEEGHPHALAFVDMRMPPGWDGLETISRLWERSPDLQVVLCTAYSDYSWEDMVARFGQTDRLVVLKKPFDPVEVLQLASSLTEKWRLLKESKLRIEDLEGMVVARTEELRQSEEHLRQSKKMEAIGRLAGGIAHDFNNILGCILGYTELTAQECPENETVQANLRGVIQAGLRGRDLVLQILTFSRQQDEEHKPTQIQEVLSEALKLLRASLPATLDIQADVDPQTPAVMADPSQIHQVLMNLVTNAAHAMNASGRLQLQLRSHVVTTESASGPPGLIPGPYVLLRVIDTGCGMDQATQERIFEPFFTTKAPGQGTGLGLSVVHGIMSTHRGAIRVDSRPGRGTTFDLFFPALPGAAASPEPSNDVVACCAHRALSQTNES